MWQVQGLRVRPLAGDLPESHCSSRAQTWAAAGGPPGATSASPRPSAARRASATQSCAEPTTASVSAHTAAALQNVGGPGSFGPRTGDGAAAAGQARLVLPAALKRPEYWTCSGMKEPSPAASWLQQAVVYTTCGRPLVATQAWCSCLGAHTQSAAEPVSWTRRFTAPENNSQRLRTTCSACAHRLAICHEDGAICLASYLASLQSQLRREVALMNHKRHKAAEMRQVKLQFRAGKRHTMYIDDSVYSGMGAQQPATTKLR